MAKIAEDTASAASPEVNRSWVSRERAYNRSYVPLQVPAKSYELVSAEACLRVYMYIYMLQYL